MCGRAGKYVGRRLATLHAQRMRTFAGPAPACSTISEDSAPTEQPSIEYFSHANHRVPPGRSSAWGRIEVDRRCDPQHLHPRAGDPEDDDLPRADPPRARSIVDHMRIIEALERRETETGGKKLVRPSHSLESGSVRQRTLRTSWTRDPSWGSDARRIADAGVDGFLFRVRGRPSRRASAPSNSRGSASGTGAPQRTLEAENIPLARRLHSMIKFALCFQYSYWSAPM